MGSSAAYHLSKTGRKILLLDKFFPPHNAGSSHGQSRIIREAYFESPLYVPLVQLAYRLWDELEQESGKKLFLKTGGLMLGKQDLKVFQGSSRSAVQHGIQYEYLNGSEIKNRFPIFKPATDTVALFEKNAGILFPEECIRTNLELAKMGDVDFHFGETVVQIKNKGDLVEIQTDKETYDVRKVIVSAGAWIGGLFPELQLPLTVKRQVLFWYKCVSANAENFLPERFPIYIWEHEADNIFYGFPDLGDGIKIAVHHQGKLTTADQVDRTVSPEEIDQMTSIVNHYFDAQLVFNYATVCMYTNTPDEDFIIDFHPGNKNIIVASACSGHGFKFSSAIGKILSEMILDEPISFDLSPFNIGRFIHPAI